MQTYPMKRLMLPALAVALAACALSAPAEAQSGPLAQALTASGGTLTRDKAESLLREQFAKLDTNHDGVLSPEEFVDARMKLFDQADTDGNGSLNISEMRAFALARMQARQAEADKAAGK